MVDVGGDLMGPFEGPVKDRIWDKMLIKKWLEAPVLKYDAANKIWLGKKATQPMKLVEIISLKKMRQEDWGENCNWCKKIRLLCLSGVSDAYGRAAGGLHHVKGKKGYPHS